MLLAQLVFALIVFTTSVLSLSTKTKTLVNEFFDKTRPDEEIALTEEDFEGGRIRAKREAISDYVDDSAMYNSDRFEGDIVNGGLTSKNVRSFIGDEPAVRVPGVQRNAVRQSYLKWPDARIPYTVSSQYSRESRQRIANAINEYTEKTCIRFVPKVESDTEYVHIKPDDGCYSLVGRTGGRQILSLGDGCVQKGIIVHEMMHTVGFFHEQSRADRDDYITINWENVEPGLEDQFDKYSLSIIDHLGTLYDYGSIMHYAKNAFSKNGLPTIDPKQKGVTIGQRRGFSANDVYKINKLYSCPNNPTVEVTESTTRTFTFPTSAPTTTGTSNCSDRRKDCQYMARAGHCDSRYSANFMRSFCPVSCNVCGASAAPCEDTRSWCGRWAIALMCGNPVFEDYMYTNCRKSCDLC